MSASTPAIERRTMVLVNGHFGASISVETIHDDCDRPIRIEIEDGSDAIQCYLTRADARALPNALQEMVA